MKTRQLILIGLFAGLTAIGALLTIPLPFSPVPVTLQIFFTLLAGVILGSRGGALSQIIYLLLGGIGLPVFAGGNAGFQFLVGPTAGYLWGFVMAAYVVGLITEKKSTLQMDLIAMVTGLILIYLFGTLILYWVLDITLTKALAMGVIPFLIGDVIKVLIAAILSDQLRKKIPDFMQTKN